MRVFLDRNAERVSPITVMARINSPVIASCTKINSSEEKAEYSLEPFSFLRTGMLKNYR